MGEYALEKIIIYLWDFIGLRRSFLTVSEIFGNYCVIFARTSHELIASHFLSWLNIKWKTFFDFN